MTRQEHLAWCKQRALEYVDRGELGDAVASMASDLAKHPETNGPHIQMLTVDAMLFQIPRGKDAVRRWVEGFN